MGRNGMGGTQLSLTPKGRLITSPCLCVDSSFEPDWRPPLPSGRLPGFTTLTRCHSSPSRFMHLAYCEAESHKYSESSPDLLPSGHLRVFCCFFFLATEILPHPLYHIRYPCNLKTRNLISGSFGTHSLLVFDPLLSTHLWISYCHCLGLNPIWRNYYLCDFEFGDWNSLGLDFHIYKMGIKIWAPECL